jgi:hypothetical protein
MKREKIEDFHTHCESQVLEIWNFKCVIVIVSSIKYRPVNSQKFDIFDHPILKKEEVETN